MILDVIAVVNIENEKKRLRREKIKKIKGEGIEKDDNIKLDNHQKDKSIWDKIKKLLK